MKARLIDYKNFLERNAAIITFFMIFIFLLPLIFIGLDVTDTGFHLTEQDLANFLGIKYAGILHFPILYCFSDIIGGWWLKLTEPFGLVGAKLGGVLVFSLSGAISIYTIKTLFKPYWLLPFVVLVASFFAVNPYLDGTVITLHYFSIPMFLGVIFICFFIKMTRLESEPNKSSYIFAIISGFLMFLILIAKMSCMSIILVPFISIWLCYFFNKNEFKTHFIHCLIVYFVFACSLILLFLYMDTKNVLFDYLAAIHHYIFPTITHDKYHGFMSAAITAIKELVSVVPSVLIIIIPPILLIKYCQNKKFIIILTFLLLLFLEIHGHYFHLSNWCYFKYFILSYTQQSLVIFVLFFALTLFGLYFISKNDTNKKAKYYLFTFFFLAFYMPIVIWYGTATGIDKIIQMIWPISVLCPMVLLKVSEFKKYNTWRISILLLIIGLIVITGIFGLRILYSSSYRDNVTVASYIFNRKNTATMQAKRLKWTLTSSQRQKSFDSLIKQIKNHTKPNDVVLAYINIPMVFYATNTRPYASRAWPRILSNSDLKIYLAKLCITDTPKLIVRSLVDTCHHNWAPITANTRGIESLIPINKAVNKQCNPKLIWKNNDFEILVPTVNHK